MGDHKYKKQLTFKDITLTTIGYIIGAGIFAVIGLTSKFGKQYTWLSIILCGLSVICTGLSYSELSSAVNTNGGEYVMVKEVFGSKIFSKLVAVFTAITEILVCVSIAFGLGNYLSKFIPVNQIVLASICLGISAYINYCGIRESVTFTNIGTVIEVSGLLLIILFGLSSIKTDMFNVSKIKSSEIKPILIGSALIYFAFMGYDIIIELTEETKNSETVIPTAMMTGIIISVILYTLVAIVSISSIGWKNMSTSKAPMYDVAKKLLGKFGIIIYYIALVSMANTLLLSHVGTSRFIHAVSRDLKLPGNFDKIDKVTNTPKNAIILVTVVTFIGLFLGNLENSVYITNIGVFVLFAIVNLAVIVYRKKNNDKRPFKIPLNINNIPIPAVIGLISSLYFGYVLVNKD